MKQILKMSLITSLVLLSSTLVAQETADQEIKRDRIKSVKAAVGTFAPVEDKTISTVDNFGDMFKEGKVSGQLKSIYAGYKQKEVDVKDTYATAVGGELKYELAKFYGFNAGVAFRTSYDINFMTGDRADGKQNSELSSSDGHYTQLSEAYINYNYSDLNLRAGRQILETPLADSDDIRMIPNTFEAYVATYNLNGFEIMAGNIQRWQGVDAGLDDGWIKTGEDGTWFGGVSYNEDFEFNAWYYNITQMTDASYFDIGYNYTIDDGIDLHVALQYLDEKELTNSGYAANIYGAVGELVVYDIGFNIAYNKADRKIGKQSFSGVGGGTIFTSMDTMIIDAITQDREARAVVSGISYEINEWRFLYAYGDFKGKANSLGEKAHIAEQNIGFEYALNDRLFVAAIFVHEEDKQSVAKTQNDFDRMQAMIAYNF